MKNYNHKKIILVLFLAMLFSFSPIQTKKAGAWDAMAASVWKDTQEKIDYTVKGTIMGSLRQSAISLLSREMDRFISGVTRNGVRFVTNWESYLIKNPTRNAQRYINDYISHALSGRGSSASYQKSPNSVLGASAVALSNEGFGKAMVLGDESAAPPTGSTYAENMMEVGQQVIEPKEECEVTYFEEPANMFESETLANMNLYVNGGDNMPSDFERCIAEKYEQKKSEETLIATTEKIANQGFESEKTEDGYVLKPGILFKDAKANVENLPNLAIAAATSIPELVAATVTKAISGLMESTIKGVERAIVREADMITNSAIKQTNKAVNEYGPGALYK